MSILKLHTGKQLFQEYGDSPRLVVIAVFPNPIPGS